MIGLKLCTHQKCKKKINLCCVMAQLQFNILNLLKDAMEGTGL